MKTFPKNWLILIGLLIVAFLSGCSGVFTTNSGINQPDFRTGTQGIEISLLENSLPATMYENTPLTLAFELWNKGSYDFLNGVYSVSYDPSYMTLDRSAGELPELYGKSVENPTGEKRIVALLGTTKSLPSQLERITLPLVITACYEYSTIASPAVCIDTDILKQIPSNKKSCAVKSLSFSGQGAPIAVTSIVPRMYAGAGETA